MPRKFMDANGVLWDSVDDEVARVTQELRKQVDGIEKKFNKLESEEDDLREQLKKASNNFVRADSERSIAQKEASEARADTQTARLELKIAHKTMRIQEQTILDLQKERELIPYLIDDKKTDPDLLEELAELRGEVEALETLLGEGITMRTSVADLLEDLVNWLNSPGESGGWATIHLEVEKRIEAIRELNRRSVR